MPSWWRRTTTPTSPTFTGGSSSAASTLASRSRRWRVWPDSSGGGAPRRSVARIHVVLDSVFPLGEIYMKELARYGVPIHVIDAKDLCADPGGVIDAASSKGCDG